MTDEQLLKIQNILSQKYSVLTWNRHIFDCREFDSLKTVSIDFDLKTKTVKFFDWYTDEELKSFDTELIDECIKILRWN